MPRAQRASGCGRARARPQPCLRPRVLLREPAVRGGGGARAPKPSRCPPLRAANCAARSTSCRTSTFACAVTGHPSKSATSAPASSQARAKPFSARKSAAQATAALGAVGCSEHNSTNNDMRPPDAPDTASDAPDALAARSQNAKWRGRLERHARRCSARVAAVQIIEAAAPRPAPTCPGATWRANLTEQARHRQGAPGVRVPERFVEPGAYAHRADA